MGRGKRERRKASGSRATPAGVPIISDQGDEIDARPRRPIRQIALGVGAAIAILAVAAGGWWWHSGRQQRAASPSSALPPAHPPASYVGQQVCGQCHKQAEQGWRGSHHDLAMQPATDATVAGDFKNSRFSYAGVTSTFSRRDGKFVVRTDGPDGALHDYDVKYTFGAAPLQQYLIEFPDGRLQALSIAWDTRLRGEGGQRWFHLYPGQNVNHRDELHWTGPSQNWNYMCAECHSTGVRKNYDPKTRRFATSYAEVNVACEACHGPGSNHVAWARKERDWQRLDGGTKGLGIALHDRRGVTWTISADAGNAQRAPAGRPAPEVEMCGRCHARRGQFSDDYVHGRPLGDTHRVGLLDDRLYYPDGQIRDEVYEYGSFLQSKMFHRGVTCSDCHDPHTLKLRAPGFQVCLGCHANQKYAPPAHHFHPEGSRGADCVGCHMPTTTYMVVDPRHDHSLRIPRPDLSVKLGVPNACTRCHAGRPAEWAAKQVDAWYGHTPRGYQRYAEALRAASVGGPGAADLYRATGRDAEGERVLRGVLGQDERSAAAHHGLGLLLVRQKRMAEAMPELEAAARLAPDSARYGYVYAVGLGGTGNTKQAVEALERTLARHPNDRDILSALVAYEREQNRPRRALVHARRLAEIEPTSAEVRQLVERVEAEARRSAP